MSQLSLTTTQVKYVAELLMGAAFADGDYDGHEAETIGDILRGLVPNAELPDEVTAHLARFDIDEFDAANAAAALELGTDEERLGVLSLVNQVADADGVHDLAETEYLHKLAGIFGVAEESYDEHTIEVLEISELPKPPPIPGH